MKIPSILLNDLQINFSSNLTATSYNTLDNKVYIFNRNQESNSQFNGIKRYGAYKEISNNEVNFFFIFKDEYRNLANDIFKALIGRSSPGTFSGMQKMFNVPFSSTNLERLTLKKYTLEAATECLKNFDLKHSEINSPCFVFYIEKNNHEEEQRELYRYFKFEFLKRQVGFQVVTHEKLSFPQTLKWSVSSIGLQIFSKLGGIPWKVKPSKDNCLILGIGQSYELTEEGVEKQFAYSVCIDSSGLFKKVAILSTEQDERNNFYEKIESSIISLIEEKEFEGYNKVAIHIPFKIKYKIIESITNAAKKISNEIEVKVIKVNLKNKYFGFSQHLTKIPYESSYIFLGSGQYLVWFEGLNYGKENVFKKTGNPVHIEFLKLDDESDDRNNLVYLQDVLNLSGGNWRGFNAKSMPISIYYSQIIANFTQEFQKLDEFDKDVFVHQKPWFL